MLIDPDYAPGRVEDPDDPRCARLMAADDMEPIAGTVDLDAPLAEVWSFFRDTRRWSEWNSCFSGVYNTELELGAQLIWAFRPLKPWMLYRMPAMARIVELEQDERRCLVTWRVSALPGFYARHSYHAEALDNGGTRFGSWEKAMGPSFRLSRRFWLAHFTFVRDRSLAGAEAHFGG